MCRVEIVGSSGILPAFCLNVRCYIADLSLVGSRLVPTDFRLHAGAVNQGGWPSGCRGVGLGGDLEKAPSHVAGICRGSTGKSTLGREMYSGDPPLLLVVRQSFVLFRIP